MTTKSIHRGTPVIVRTERGDETGVVLSSSYARPGEQVRYTVCFADRTQSTWNEHQVRVARPIGYEADCARCGETFNPADADDLEHIADSDGNECGGQGKLVGSWSR